MNTNMLRTIAASAVLALSLLGSAVVAPALAEDEVEVICWDTVIGGVEEVECDTVANLVAECALTDPDNTSDVCAQAADANKSRPSRTAMGPQSLTGSEEGGQGGGGGGGIEPLDLDIKAP